MSTDEKTILKQIDELEGELRKIVNSPIIDSLARQKNKKAEAQGAAVREMTRSQVELIKSTILLAATTIFEELKSIRNQINALAN